MVRKNWIIITCCVAIVAMVCAVSYAEKAEKGSIPAVIEAAIKALIPNAVLGQGGKEQEPVNVYEVKIKDGSKEADVTVAEDGTAINAEYTESLDSVPPAVADVIKAQKAEVKEVVKLVEYAQIKVVKLDTPATSYEAEVVKDGKKTEMKIAADGKILEQKVMKNEKDKEKEEKDEEKGEHKDKDKDKD
jgi:hypothetical protein